MAKKKEVKKMPAGQKDELTIAYTSFASNLEKSEIKVGEGKEFDNDALLAILGFKEDGKGGLKLPVEGHDFEIAPNGEIIRKDKKGKILTGSKTQVENER